MNSRYYKNCYSKYREEMTGEQLDVIFIDNKDSEEVDKELQENPYGYYSNRPICQLLTPNVVIELLCDTFYTYPEFYVYKRSGSILEFQEKSKHRYNRKERISVQMCDVLKDYL